MGCRTMLDELLNAIEEYRDKKCPREPYPDVCRETLNAFGANIIFRDGYPMLDRCTASQQTVILPAQPQRVLRAAENAAIAARRILEPWSIAPGWPAGWSAEDQRLYDAWFETHGDFERAAEIAGFDYMHYSAWARQHGFTGIPMPTSLSEGEVERRKAILLSSGSYEEAGERAGVEVSAMRAFARSQNILDEVMNAFERNRDAKYLEIYHTTDSPAEAAKVAGVSMATWWRWLRKMNVPASRVRGPEG